MTIQYNGEAASRKPFSIQDYVDFDENGRALCPACSPNYKNHKKTLSLVPNGNGAYKCHRSCTPEEIREALGVPKPGIMPTAIAKSQFSASVPSKEKKQKAKAKATYSQQQIEKMNADLMRSGEIPKKARDWLETRFKNLEIMGEFKLGFVRSRIGKKMTYAISIPIPTPDPNNDLYYIKKRIAPWDEELQKSENYAPWSQYGVPPTVFFSYYPPNAKQTWLCEGEWDAIALGNLVRDYRDDVAIASFTCGCTTVPPKEELARLPGEVVIFYDRNDTLTKRGTRPGEEGAKKVAKALGDRAKIGSVPMPKNCTVKGWDISDALKTGFSLESFERAACEAIPYAISESNSFAASSRSLVQLYDEAPDYVDWLVPGLFTSNELYCLAAEPRKGKSLFALGLAKAVASGGRFLDRPCAQGSVLYVCREDPDDKVKERLYAQEWTREEMENVTINNDFTLDQLPDLTSYIKQTQPRLLILDTLSRIQKSNAKENSAEIADTLAPLQDLAQKENICVLVVHHTRKRNIEQIDLNDIFDAVRGSGAIRATCRGMLVLTNTKEGMRLAAENGRTATQDLRVVLDPTSLTWKLRGQWTPPTVNQSHKETIWNWIQTYERGTIDEIYEATNIHRKSVHKVLTRLIAEEKLSRMGKHRATLYYKKRFDNFDNVEDLSKSQNIDEVNNRMPSSTKSEKSFFSVISERSDQTDHNTPTDHEKSFFVEECDQSSSDSNTVGNIAIDNSSTTTVNVELNPKNMEIVISCDQSSTDHDDTTSKKNDFSKKQEQVETRKKQESAELQRLVGVFHKEEGFYLVSSQKGQKLRVRKAGETREKTILLKDCESRREYENYCVL